MSVNVFLQQSFNIVSEYNSRNYQSNLKALKADDFLYSVFLERVNYLKTDKKSVLELIKKMAFNYKITLAKKSIFDSQLYNSSYLRNHVNYYDLDSNISDFKYKIHILKNMVLAKNTVNKMFLDLKKLVESFDTSFIKKGYALDFYCHDYCEITSNNKNLNDYVWLTKTEYLSTHIMLKDDYQSYIKSCGGSFIIIDLETMKRIKS
jgi:hypothetical protein